jgi:hypothetical protein
MNHSDRISRLVRTMSASSPAIFAADALPSRFRRARVSSLDVTLFLSDCKAYQFWDERSESWIQLLSFSCSGAGSVSCLRQPVATNAFTGNELYRYHSGYNQPATPRPSVVQNNTGERSQIVFGPTMINDSGHCAEPLHQGHNRNTPQVRVAHDVPRLVGVRNDSSGLIRQYLSPPNRSFGGDR